MKKNALATSAAIAAGAVSTATAKVPPEAGIPAGGVQQRDGQPPIDSSQALKNLLGLVEEPKSPAMMYEAGFHSGFASGEESGFKSGLAVGISGTGAVALGGAAASVISERRRRRKREEEPQR